MRRDNSISKTKLLLILLIILVFLLGLFAGARIFYHDDTLDNQNEESQSSATVISTAKVGEENTATALYLLNLSDELVRSVNLKNAAGHLNFQADVDKKAEAALKPASETIFRLSQPNWDIIDQAKVQTLVQSLLSIRFNTVAAAEGGTSKDFGFDQPLAQVEYQLDNGTSMQLMIGKTLAGGESYAKLQGDEQVYLVPGIAERMQRGPLDLLEDSLQTIDNKSLKSISIYRKSDQAEYVFSVINKAHDATHTAGISPVPSPSPTPTPSDSTSSLSERKWELVSPVHWELKSSEINNMATELSVLYPLKYLAYDAANLAQYGLDQAEYKVVLQSEYEKLVLEIGDYYEAGQRFAKLDKQAVVFVLNMNQFNLLERQLLDLTNNNIATFNIKEVSALEITSENVNFKAELMVPNQADLEANPELQESFIVNGENANLLSSTNDHYFKQVYRSLIALQVDGVDLSAPSDYAADFKILYTLKSNLSDVPTKALLQEDGTFLVSLEFALRDEESYFVYLNGKATGFFMRKSQLDENRNGMKGFYKTWARLQEAIQNNERGLYDFPSE